MTDEKETLDIDPTSNLGPDSTATFDQGPSNPTEYASSEALGAVTDDDEDAAATGDDDDEELEDYDEDEEDLDAEDLDVDDADEAAL
jgi:hypothetical protein